MKNPHRGELRAAGLTLSYAGTPALRDLSLEVAPRGRLAVIGRSGAGKTTLLRVLAGLTAPEAGSVTLNGNEATRGPDIIIPPERRGVGLVFQELALWSHMTVGETLAWTAASEQVARRLLEQVGLADRREAYPHQLSGGERQRLALARALAPVPAVLLLDEPFAHLDAPLRWELSATLLELLEEQGTTLVLVTHQRQQAFDLAEQVLVISAGEQREAGLLADVVAQPRSREAVELLGLGTVVEGTAQEAGFETPLGLLQVEGEGAAALVRPDQVRLAEEGVQGVVARATTRRPDALTRRYELHVDVGPLRVRLCADTLLAPGAQVQLRVEGPCRLLG